AEDGIRGCQVTGVQTCALPIFAQREQYRGTVIAQLSLQEIEEIYKLRSMIEPYLLQQALPNITPETIEGVQELIESSRVCTDLRSEERRVGNAGRSGGGA